MTATQHENNDTDKRSKSGNIRIRLVIHLDFINKFKANRLHSNKYRQYNTAGLGGALRSLLGAAVYKYMTVGRSWTISNIFAKSDSI